MILPRSVKEPIIWFQRNPQDDPIFMGFPPKKRFVVVTEEGIRPTIAVSWAAHDVETFFVHHLPLTREELFPWV